MRQRFNKSIKFSGAEAGILQVAKSKKLSRQVINSHGIHCMD